MIREFMQQAAGMAATALHRELANQLGITHDTIEWAMSAVAVKILPLIGPGKKSSGCQGCPA